tara:strand:- start:4372 stop:4587 length:216 start_codon:yes stop_codon:yes gene_type:complete
MYNLAFADMLYFFLSEGILSAYDLYIVFIVLLLQAFIVLLLQAFATFLTTQWFSPLNGKVVEWLSCIKKLT